MKIDELIKMIRNDGWFEDRQRGSHKIFKHKIKAGTLSVPYHKGKEVPTGTANSFLKKAGLK
jgi:predicted RNA binding protein YcfA (HicA-like mRNA interferase family)